MAEATAETDTASPSLRPALWEPPVYVGDAAALDARVATLTARLTGIAAQHGVARFASSLAAEDMVLTDAIARLRLPIAIFTLDTGRLPAATLALLDAVEARYGLTIERFAPRPDAVADYVADHGLNGFYDGAEQRKRCCQIRKVEPLARALADADAWLTGQRQQQAVTRTALPLVEHDIDRGGIAKYNPLADWSEAEVWAYLDAYQVPVNALHRQGYASIGCEPCTRAVRAGEDVRAGRWWWEAADAKECGLHEINLARVANQGQRP